MLHQELIILAQKVFKNEATEEEQQKLFDWYKSFDDAEVEVIIVDEPYQKELLKERMLNRIKDFIKHAAEKESMDNPSPKAKFIYKTLWFKAAASIIIFISISLLFYQIIKKTGYDETYAKKEVVVPKQQIRKIILPDSTVVWLNADSKLTYAENFGLKTREVSLEGEGFFDVKHDAYRIFIVKTSGTTIKVLGTAFNIKAYASQAHVLVTVTRGKVQVEDKRKNIVVLTPNQQVKYEIQKDTLVEMEVNAGVYTSWTSGNLEFLNETFGEIAATLERKYNVTIQFKNDALRNCTFIASFENNTSLERVLDLLCKINTASFESSADEKEIMISGKACEESK